MADEPENDSGSEGDPVADALNAALDDAPNDAPIDEIRMHELLTSGLVGDVLRDVDDALAGKPRDPDPYYTRVMLPIKSPGNMPTWDFSNRWCDLSEHSDERAFEKALKKAARKKT